MFASPITIPHEGGSLVLNRINSGDPYASEYSAKGATMETRMRIRHSKTNGSGSKPAYDRHNVEIVQNVFADGDTPAFYRKAYVVIELLPDDPDVSLSDGLFDWLVSGAVLETLNEWRS